MIQVIQVFIFIGRLNISMDELYEECVTANSIQKGYMTEPQKKEKWQSKETVEKWMQVLQSADLPNIQAVVSFVLSTPSSTGFVKRILSLSLEATAVFC